MYSHTLMGRLLSTYKPAVLALKVGGKLKDAASIDWDAVTALVNAHERDTGDGSPSGSQAAMSATVSRGRDRSVPTSHIPASTSDANSAYRGEFGQGKCFNCGKFGHIIRECQEKLKPRFNDRESTSSNPATKTESLPRQERRFIEAISEVVLEVEGTSIGGDRSRRCSTGKRRRSQRWRGALNPREARGSLLRDHVRKRRAARSHVEVEEHNCDGSGEEGAPVRSGGRTIDEGGPIRQHGRCLVAECVDDISLAG